jgi:hypothetical protein
MSPHPQRTTALAAALLAVQVPLVADAALFRVGDVAFIQETLATGSGQTVLVCADFDSDGHLDLVVAGGVVAGARDGGFLHIGDGRGRFELAGPLALGPDVSHVAAADIDGDGNLDLVAANHETDHVTLLRGDGLGRFVPAPGSPLTVDVAPHPHFVAVRDLDADGREELVIDSRDRRGLHVLPGLGAGRLGPGRTVPIGGDPYRGFAIGDVDLDGLPDLVTPNQDAVAVSINSGNLEFAAAVPVPAARPFAVALADFDADGRPDIVAASESEPLVDVLFGDGEGGFRAADDADLIIFSGPKRIATGDVNGDGFADALVTSWSSDGLIVLGGPSGLRPVRLPLGDNQNPWGLAVADFNEDGIDDFVIADGVGSSATVFLSFEP